MLDRAILALEGFNRCYCLLCKPASRPVKQFQRSRGVNIPCADPPLLISGGIVYIRI